MMKTKLLAIMMMGLATFGSLGGLAMAQQGTTDYSNAWGFGSTNGVAGIAGIVGTSSAGNNAANDGLIQTIKKTINWVLGMLAVIALAVSLWWGFQMVTAAGDDKKYQSGFTILKQAAVGLIVVGISWIIVSFIFWVIGALATTGQAPTNNAITPTN